MPKKRKEIIEKAAKEAKRILPKAKKKKSTKIEKHIDSVQKGQFSEEEEFGLDIELNEADPRDFDDEFDNGPTGHGDQCFSDADPGL